MLSTVQIFDLIKAKHGLTSDYQLAKALGVTAGLISKHRHSSFGLDDQTAQKAADLLSVDPAYLILCGLVESAKRTETKSALLRLLILAELNPNQLAYSAARRFDGALKRRATD